MEFQVVISSYHAFWVPYQNLIIQAEAKCTAHTVYIYSCLSTGNFLTSGLGYNNLHFSIGLHKSQFLLWNVHNREYALITICNVSNQLVEQTVGRNINPDQMLLSIKC